jgi:hypothetical protein
MTTKRLVNALAVSLVLCTSLVAGSAAAEVKTLPAAKVSLDIPSGWTTKSDPDMMFITDPTQDLGFVVLVTEVADLKTSVAGLDAKLAKVLTDVKWAGKPKAMKLNGMDGIKNSGTGKIAGKASDLGLVVLTTPAGKALIVVVAVDSNKKAAHKAEIEAFVTSIKPAP